MSVIFDSQKRAFKLDTASSSLVLHIYDENYLLELYYGARIPDIIIDKCKRRPSASFSPVDPVVGEHGFSPDSAPMAYGCNGGDFRISALSVRNAEGENHTDIRYLSHEIYKGKKDLSSVVVREHARRVRHARNYRRGQRTRSKRNSRLQRIRKSRRYNEKR